MAFEICKTPPGKEDLAISAQGYNPVPYFRMAESHAKYWQEVRNDASDPFVEQRANYMYIRMLGAQATIVLLSLGEQQNPEFEKCKMLSVLAISAAQRHFSEAVDEAGVRQVDAIGVGSANVLTDMKVGNTAYDYRMHVLDNAPEAPERWYRDGSLYLREVRPASDHVTPGMVQYCEDHRLEVDFSSMKTLYPYLATLG